MTDNPWILTTKIWSGRAPRGKLPSREEFIGVILLSG